MNRLLSAVVGCGCLLALAGCGERVSQMPGPTVNKFTGKLLVDGKQTSFKEGDVVVLKLTHSSAQSFGVPIKNDGTFTVGEMPIGKYSGTMEIKVGNADPAKRGGAPLKISVPDGFEIKDGQTEYTVELGKNFKY